MKTNLPASRNRNLPPPPAAAAAVRPPLTPAPPDEPRRGPSALRSFLAMIFVTGLLGCVLWFYMRGVQSDARVADQLTLTLEGVGRDIWATGKSFGLVTETEDQKKDLADLPRIVAALKLAAKKVAPEIKIIEGDPPPGKGIGTHQIAYLFNQRILFVVRVRYNTEDGVFRFLGEANRAVPSRKELEEKAAVKTKQKAPDSPETPHPTAPAEEKVSEEPANPQ